MGKIKKILESNKIYAEKFGKKSELPVPPVKNIAILTCMDSRVDPLPFTGLDLGDAHIIRNGGGRASEDAIRSLILSSQLLGTNEFYVIHHSDCGLEAFTDKELDEKFKDKIDETELEKINWLTIDDREESVRFDVNKIKSHPLIPENIEIYGFIFDVKTGELIQVE